MSFVVVGEPTCLAVADPQGHDEEVLLHHVLGAELVPQVRAHRGEVALVFALRWFVWFVLLVGLVVGWLVGWCGVCGGSVSGVWGRPLFIIFPCAFFSSPPLSLPSRNDEVVSFFVKGICIPYVRIFLFCVVLCGFVLLYYLRQGVVDGGGEPPGDGVGGQYAQEHGKLVVVHACVGGCRGRGLGGGRG